MPNKKKVSNNSKQKAKKRGVANRPKNQSKYVDLLYTILGTYVIFIVLDVVCGIVYKNTDIVGFKIVILVHGGLSFIMMFLGLLVWFGGIIGIFTPTKHVGYADVRSGSSSARVDVYTYDDDPMGTLSLGAKAMIWGFIIFSAWVIGMLIILKLGVTL